MSRYDRLAADAVEGVVWQVLGQVASSDGVDTKVIASELGLDARLEADLGLTSLQVLDAAGRISERLRPGAESSVAITDVQSVADLCRLFQASDATVERTDEPGGGSPDPDLEAGLRRAGKRRDRRGRRT